MVFYYHPQAHTPDSDDWLIYVGKDKHENESLIQYGLPHDVWCELRLVSHHLLVLSVQPDACLVPGSTSMTCPQPTSTCACRLAPACTTSRSARSPSACSWSRPTQYRAPKTPASTWCTRPGATCARRPPWTLARCSPAACVSMLRSGAELNRIAGQLPRLQAGRERCAGLTSAFDCRCNALS